MLILTSLISLFLGFFTAFISSILYYSQYNIYESKIAKSPSKIKQVNYLKQFYQEKVDAFYLFELTFYFLFVSSSISFLNIITFSYEFSFLILISSLPVFFIFRYVFYSLGIRYSNKLVVSLLPLFYLLAKINTPIMNVLYIISEKIGGRKEDDDTREELDAMVETAHDEGSIDASEYRILKNIIKFKEVFVSDVMTPRTVVFSLNADKTIEEVLNNNGLKMYSRIPLWEGESLDKGLIGYILSKDILQAALSGKTHLTLREFMRTINFIPENVELDVALDQFLNNKQHLMAVIDEYGGFDGLISMEDVLETILGVEIMDEADRIEDLRSLAIKKRDKRISIFVKNNQS